MSAQQQKHRVLVIGVGSIGERHLRCFGKTERCEQLSFVEPNEALRKTIADRYSIPQSYARLEDAPLDRFDAAVIATPAQLHIPIATTLARAGIHLLIEKPLSTGLDGIDILRREFESRRLVASVAYVWRAHPVLIPMRQAIASGRFGKPLEITSVTGQHFPTFRPAYRQTYYTKHETGGGAIQDAITHMVNMGQWLVGPIDRLVADAAHQQLAGAEQVEDLVHVLARHGAVLGTDTMNQFQSPNEVVVTVVCECGTVRLEGHLWRWRWMIEPQPKGEWHDEPFAGTPERDIMFINQANTFLDAVEGRGVPGCTLDEGLATLKANLAMLRSVREGKWETLA